jgi:hypothetical protein
LREKIGQPHTPADCLPEEFQLHFQQKTAWNPTADFGVSDKKKHTRLSGIRKYVFENKI